MELSGYLETARRWWWTLLIATWVAGLAGYIVATRIPPTYEARSTLLVGPIQGDLNTLRASGQLALTYAELTGGVAPAAPKKALTSRTKRK